MFGATAQAFIDMATASSLSILHNGYDLFVYPDISDDVIYSLRSNFQLHIDEIVLYVRDTSFWNNRNQGLVVTDWGITCLPDNNSMNDLVQIPWEKVHHVEYSGQCFYFFYSVNREDCSPIHVSFFLKETDDNDVCKANGEILCSIFNDMSQTQIEKDVDDIWEQTAEKYDKLMEEGKRDEALKLALDYRKEQGNVGLTPQIAMLYLEKGQGDKALSVLEEDFNALSDDSQYWKSVLCCYKYDIFNQLKDNSNARKCCLYVIKNTTSDATYMDINILREAEEDFRKIEKEYIDCFLEQPYQTRKLIVPVNSYSDLSQKTLSVLDIKNLPAINFPIGHPIANQLYVGHPYIPSKYIPFEHYELELIEDKIREFCQIAQYLGATEISIECVNATSNNKDGSLNQKLSGSIDSRLSSVSANSERNQSNKFLEDISQSINLHQKFSPKIKPALPSNLLWYPNEPSWQRLYDQRMQGAILEHEERIETKKTQVVENSQLMQIAAEVKWLFVEAKGNWEQSMEKKFEAHENAVLAIRVEFAPLESLQENICSSVGASIMLDSHMTSAEKEYLDEVKACLEEGDEFSSRERRLLEKFRIRLNVSEKRAKELEESLLSLSIKLTAEEKEYQDEYKACLEEDGEITSKEHRLLNKLRLSLGISEERAKEIENY